VVITLLLACSDPLPADPVVGTELMSIRVEPTELTVITGPDGAEAVQFVAIGTDAQDQEQELGTVEWTVSNRSAGEIDETGLFTPAVGNGGITWVTARLDGVEGVSTLTVLYEDAINDEGLDITPFGAQVASEQEFWLYPEDGVSLPRNTPAIRFNWSNPGGATAYRLRFISDVTDISVYTSSTAWTADEATWLNLASTNAGGDVTVRLTALTDAGLIVAPDRAVNVNRMDGRGSILYWSTSAAGILEIPYGSTEPTDFLSQASTGRCLGCHVVSRDSSKIAFTWDGGDGGIGLANVNDKSYLPGNATRSANFKTWAPDGDMLIATHVGQLSLLDGDGYGMWDIPHSGQLTHPDWSPDGDLVVAVETAGHSADWTFSGGRLVLLDHLGNGIFSDTRVLYEAPSGYKAYYPTFSPDGAWIAFNVSTGDAYDDSDAQLWVVDRENKHGAIRLGGADFADGMTNSWVRWGPEPDDDIFWLAFSSKRAYGDVVNGSPQIWVSAFDPAQALDGQDPSYPAFWLPGQNAGQSNHIPVWIE